MGKNIFWVAICLFFVFAEGAVQELGALFLFAFGFIGSICYIVAPKRFLITDKRILEEKREEFTWKSGFWGIAFSFLFLALGKSQIDVAKYWLTRGLFVVLVVAYVFWERKFRR